MPKENEKPDILKIDRNMELNHLAGAILKWYLPMEPPLRLSGFPWIGKDKVYRRLPVNPVNKLPEAVEYLANCTAGGQIQFMTNSTKLAVKVQLSNTANMYHMPATGQCGFDCYLGMPGKKFYCSTTKYDHREISYECKLYECNEVNWKNVTLNFPLYQGVKEVYVGLDADADIIGPPAYWIEKPIIFYGTSITQGGCASRPGMAYTNIISRKLNMECINLGFSGNGRGEPEVARTICEIENPACIVLDYEANAWADGLLEKTLQNFISILRDSHPEVPILLVSKIRYANENYNLLAYQKRIYLKEFQFRLVEELKKSGDRNIYFYDGEDLLGNNFDECTVDGVHPTDFGFIRMGEKLANVLEKIIKNTDTSTKGSNRHDSVKLDMKTMSK